MTTIDRPPLNLTVTSLRLIEAAEPVTDGYLTRSDVEPYVQVDPEGVFILTLRNQGRYGDFDLPYIQSQVIYQSERLLAILVAYHGTEPFGKKKHLHVSKGQFWRFYVQTDQGWLRQNWQQLSDIEQVSIHMAWFNRESEWMKEPGKLRVDKRPADKTVYTTYKVVEVRDGRYYSLYKPEEEYILGQEKKQAARPGHKGGYFSYPELKLAEQYATGSRWEWRKREVVLLEVEIRGRIIRYPNKKWASTYLKPIRELARFN